MHPVNDANLKWGAFQIIVTTHDKLLGFMFTFTYNGIPKNHQSQHFLIPKLMASAGAVVGQCQSCQSLANLDLLDINGDTSLSQHHTRYKHTGGTGPKIPVIGGKVRKTIVLGAEQIFLLI